MYYHDEDSRFCGAMDLFLQGGLLLTFGLDTIRG
jgi:hypothetical protein